MAALGSTNPGRVRELDALRGLAAAMVVFSHFDALWVWEAKPVWVQRLLGSPLRLLVGGHEAVILFFLISGFALSVPYLQPRAPGYFAFLVKRVFRIYVPYLAALMLALGGAAAFHSRIAGMPSWFEHTWSEPVDASLVLRHIEFLGDYDNRQFNAAFWTLIHEMRISIVFPALFVMVRAMGARGAAAAAAIVLASTSLAAGFFGDADWLATVHYVALFMAGSLIAQNRDAIARWFQRLDGAARRALGISALLVFAYGRTAEQSAGGRLEDWLVALGAAGVLLVSMNVDAARRALVHPALQWLGRISYSVYLVHLVVLLALVHGLGRSFSPVAVFALYLAGTAAPASLFHAWIERPAAAAGRRVALRMEALGAIPRTMVMKAR